MVNFTVMTFGDITNTFIAAASFGKGRIVVFSWEGLVGDFIKGRERNEDLHDNIIKWTTKSPADVDIEEVKVIDIANITEFRDVEEQLGDKPAVIAWKSVKAKSEEFIVSLTVWIRDGGAFVCGLTPWAWARGAKIEQIPTFHLLKVSFLSILKYFCNIFSVRTRIFKINMLVKLVQDPIKFG